jgi:hypothetical protein
VALKTLARKISKIIYFIALLFFVGHILPPAEKYINYDIARNFALFITDNESADSMYDAYSYIDWFTMLVIIVPVYILTMKLIRKVRNI